MKKKPWWHKRIPTSAAFFILFISIWVTSFLLQKGTIFTGLAAPDKTPRNVSISNITDTSFTVNFTTIDKAQAAVKLDGNTNETIFDLRYKGNSNASYYSHFITVRGLTSNSIYRFSILSEGEIFTDGGKEYTLKTGPKIDTNASKQNLISGKVVLPDGTPAQDTIVELEIPGAQTISELTNDDGSYKIMTNSIRTADLKKYFPVSSTTQITLRFKRQNLNSEIKSVFANSITLPQAVLSYTYDFTNTGEAVEETLPSKLKAGISSEGQLIRITSPQNGSSFVDTRPRFQGTALPGKVVNITIESNPIRATVTADANGSWSYRPPAPLAPGEHKMTIQTVDSFGILKIFTVNFTIYAQGTQIANAQPSPTKTPTPTRAPQIVTSTPKPTTLPTSTPIPAQTIAPTQVPTGIPSPTAQLTPASQPTVTPTLLPTSSPAPTLIAVLTTSPSPTVAKATPPPSGSSGAVVITFTSIIFIIAGSALIFLL